MQNDEPDSYTKGFTDGYNDTPKSNPYEPNTVDYNIYEEAYKDGNWGC